MGTEQQYEEEKVLKYSSIFIYPFLFQRRKLKKIIRNLFDKSSSWEVDFYEKTKGHKQRLCYFYPYVQNFLYPTASWPDELVEELKSDVNLNKKRRITKHFLNTTCIRFKYKFNSVISEEFKLGNNGKVCPEIPCEFLKISLLLFPTGVGFLIVDPKINDSEEINFNKLVYFNDVFRTVKEFYFNKSLPHLVFAGNNVLTQREFLDYLLKPLRAYVTRDVHDIYDSKLFYYCYVALESDKEVINTDEYFLRFNFKTPEKLPNISERERELWEFHRWPDTLMTFSKDGGCVFSRYTISSNVSAGKTRKNVRQYYLDTLFLALFKRLSLLNFSWELSRTSYLVQGNNISKLRYEILDFTNRCWFSQLTNNQYGQDIWEHWKGVMDLDLLYQEVKNQLQELDDYITLKRQESFNKKVSLLASLGLPLSIYLSLYGTNFKEFTGLTLSEAFSQSIHSLVIITGLIFIYLFNDNIVQTLLQAVERFTKLSRTAFKKITELVKLLGKNK